MTENDNNVISNMAKNIRYFEKQLEVLMIGAPNGRELALARTNLQQARMWLNEAGNDGQYEIPQKEHRHAKP